ncbi:MAG: ComEA family DNA-binding protein [Chitinophagaceae bacterium]
MLIIIKQTSVAQDVPVPTEQQLENLTDVLEGEPEDDNFLQQLTYFKEHPLNINAATAEDLQLFRILTDLQIQNLLRYRKLLGPFINIYELQAVPSWDVATIRRLLPYIITLPALNINEEFLHRLTNGEHYILLRETRVLEKAKGYDKSLSNRYLGNRDRLFLRYKYQYKNLLQYGITADKDAGEQFFRGAQSKGFDFYSFHLFARQIGSIKAVALGDFTVNLGQGLIQWQSLAFNKSSEVISIKRQSPILHPYSSAGEFFFNRGAGLTIKKGNIEVTGYSSYKKISGNISIDTINEVEFFTSFLTSGYHRNNTEIADRNKVDQFSFGGNVSYNSTGFKFGISTVHYQFSKPLQKRNLPYNLFAITGKQWSNYSADYGFTFRNVHLFGEAAMDKNYNKAFVNGALISIDPKVDVSLLYRNLSPEYQSVYGSAFTENVSPSNEKGFYTGIVVRPASFLKIMAYADFYSFPFLKFQTDAPGKGQDYLAQLTYQPNKQVELYLRFRNEHKQSNASNVNTVTNFLVYNTRENLRVHLTYKLSPVFLLKSRVEAVFYNKNELNRSEGFLTFIEGTYKPTGNLSANLRLQYFETDDYNSRIYAYENDVLYSFSIPAFFDKGYRYYFNLSYNLGKKITLWLRFAQTIYKDKASIASGLDEIIGDTRSEGKIQLRYVF